MKPAIVIPTYWSSTDQLGSPGGVQCYDHATPIDIEHPELDACLGSLEKVLGLAECVVVILVTAPPVIEERAVHRVKDIVDAHKGLPEVVIIDSFKSMALNTLIAQDMPSDVGEPISLRGYGAIRNMGLLACCALGCDLAVFLDDDEVVLDENFLSNAAYGFGVQDRQGMPILAKSGYFLDRRNSALADRRHVKFYDRYWTKRAEFNEWMTQALAGARISRSNVLCGGCHAIRAEAFTRVAFDPYITRGEDEDYLFNLRMYGIEVWFDNKWCVRHTPPEIKDTASRFLQDVYRWTYERRKLERSNTNIDLQRVTADSLMPYPGPWLGPELPNRIRRTSFWRAMLTSEHLEYFKIFRRARREAVEYAETNCTRYLEFQAYWNGITTKAWLNEEMASILRGQGMLNAGIASRMAERAGTVDRLSAMAAARGDSGEFARVGVDDGSSTGASGGQSDAERTGELHLECDAATVDEHVTLPIDADGETSRPSAAAFGAAAIPRYYADRASGGTGGTEVQPDQSAPAPRSNVISFATGAALTTEELARSKSASDASPVTATNSETDAQSGKGDWDTEADAIGASGRAADVVGQDLGIGAASMPEMPAVVEVASVQSTLDEVVDKIIKDAAASPEVPHEPDETDALVDEILSDIRAHVDGERSSEATELTMGTSDDADAPASNVSESSFAEPVEVAEPVESAEPTETPESDVPVDSDATAESDEPIDAVPAIETEPDTSEPSDDAQAATSSEVETQTQGDQA